MVTHFIPAKGLDVTIAREFGVPMVRSVLAQLETAAKTHAPPVRVWITMRDERVRRSHVEADAQMIPDNLRFKIAKVNTGDDANDIRAGFDLARMPRDPNLPIGNRINCRCDDPSLPEPLRDSIHKTDVTQVGTRVSGEVYTEFPRAAESEFGTSEDTPARFMRTALTDVAARLQAGSAG